MLASISRAARFPTALLSGSGHVRQAFSGTGRRPHTQKATLHSFIACGRTRPSGPRRCRASLRPPSQHRLRPADVQARPLQVAEPGRMELGIVGRIRQPLRSPYAVAAPRFPLPVPMLKRWPSPGLAGGLDERVDDVVDEHVVAGVGAVAEDLGRLTRRAAPGRRSRPRRPRRAGPGGGRRHWPGRCASTPCRRGCGTC